MSNWSISDSRRTYNIEKWGDGYFDISTNGNLSVSPMRNGVKIDISKLSSELSESGLTFPILIRFLDIIHDRIDRINSAFDSAMKQHSYHADHSIIYPIKVNQQQDVIDEIISHGKERVGLEAGSKPELIAVLAKSLPGSTVICNGYKDEEYIRLAILGQQIGLKIFIVIEKLSEIQLIDKISKQTGARPLLGIRARLASAGSGNWQNSGGEDSKFGLTANQILTAIKQLSEQDLLSSLQLLHFHIGSQITDIKHIESGANEIARYYDQVRKLNVDINVIDVGGGLGVDYEGSCSTQYCSINYSIDEYASAIIAPIARICSEHSLPYPNIVCESGRALTAQHAIILSNIIDYDRQDVSFEPGIDDSHEIIAYIKCALGQIGSDATEAFAKAKEIYNKIQKLFTNGDISLSIKADAESLYRYYCRKILNIPNIQETSPDVFNQLSEKIADKLFCNLSIFQSMPDIWGIEQIFPIMPIHKLDKKPDSRAILLDITCDSDGQIKEYVDGAGIERSLPLHKYNYGDNYIVGFFMVGAYQEILGDLHNLFGDTHSVNIKLDANGYTIKNIRKGDTIADVLKTVHFQPEQIIDSISRLSRSTNQADGNKPNSQEICSTIKTSLNEYTYLHPKN